MLFIVDWTTPARGQSTQPVADLQQQVGEAIPSEDSTVADFHSLGLLAGHANIFRAACPVRAIGKEMSATQPSAADLAAAVPIFQHLRDLGICTIISFQRPDVQESKRGGPEAAIINLEFAAAKAVGIRFVNFPMANRGDESFQTLSDVQVQALLDDACSKILVAAADGGVLFHCSAGHDRTGMVAAYFRMKDQHWPVEQAIAEMRRLGHNWPKFSADGGATSWHEAHLRAIAALLPATQPAH